MFQFEIYQLFLKHLLIIRKVTSDTDLLTEYARQALASQITNQYAQIK